MSWKSTVEQREALVLAWKTGRYSKSSLSESFGVCRKTVSKWIKRFEESGESGLSDQSRAPKSLPSKTPRDVVEAALALRRKHPRWGADKIRAVLIKKRPKLTVPSARTLHRILSQEGLVEPRRRTSRPRRPKVRLTESVHPNDVWCMDFKGNFPLGNARSCYPLTVTDHCSRFLIACFAQPNESEKLTRANLQRAFEQYGMPQVIRSDNGSPFGSTGVLGLSRLSVWLLTLGIKPEHIEPGRPEQNGRHERMHRTLKAEAANPPAFDRGGQQLAFDAFRTYFNEERPHQALGQIPPAEVYVCSERQLPLQIEQFEYPSHHKTRRVLKDGEISWKSQRLRLGSALRGQTVGLREVADDLWVVSFGELELGLIDDRAMAAGKVLPRVTPQAPRRDLRLPH